MLPRRKLVSPRAEILFPDVQEPLLGLRRRRHEALRHAPDLGGQVHGRSDPSKRRGQVALAHEPRQLCELRDVVQPQIRVVLGRAREEVGGESCDPVCEMVRGRRDFERHARADREKKRSGSELGERRLEPM
jgi:hypothetical protein